jgi:hypothetical protein
MRNFIHNNRAIIQIQAIICVLIIAASIGIVTFSLQLPSTEASFTLNVFNRPASFGEALYAIPNQNFLILVTAQDTQATSASTAISMSATAPNCTVTVTPQTVTQGQVAEVTVVPIEADVGKNVTVTIQGERNGANQTTTVTFEVIEAEDREVTLGPEAAAMRNRFTQWLETNHPELGITNSTTWTDTVVNPRVLVVMHYMFLSEDWEMYVTWHVMIPPYDWTRIYLRHRFNTTAPSYAFEISSIEGRVEPQAIEVPDWV